MTASDGGSRNTVFLTHSPDALESYYGPRALAALREIADVRVNASGRVLDAEALVAEAQDATIIVSDRQTAGDAAVFAGLPDLVAFLRVAVDIRNIDVEAASRAGVLVTHATPGFAVAVAEMTLGFMLDLARGISRASVTYRAGQEPEARMGRELRGSVLGLIGFGAIAEELARIGAALGMQVLASDPYRTITQPSVTQLAMPDVLGRADFVVCLAVAMAETENLMDASAFGRMKRGSYFINVSRGNLVDEAALERALETGHLAGAAMDVGRAPDQKPSPRLAARSDVVATPHAAGLTRPAIEHQAFETVEQVRALLAGTIPPGAVNPAEATRLRARQA